MMLNPNDIHHQQSSPIIGVHHQSPQVLSIEQFLRAAKLIEQHQQHQLLINQQPTPPAAPPADHAMMSLLDVTGGGLLAKLGEEYQERLLLSKMRSASGGNIAASYGDMATPAAPNSTGSSRRSSPLSAAASPCSPSTSLLAQQQHQHGFCGGMSTPSTSATALSIGYNNFNNNSCGRSSCGSRSSINATTPPATHCSSSRAGGSRGASRQSRAAHNELEKNRRANLRGHLEALKAALPPEVDTQRDTTLSLLTRARNHIRTIKEQKAQLLAKRTALFAEHLRFQSIQQQQQQQLPNRNCFSSSHYSTSSIPVTAASSNNRVTVVDDVLPVEDNNNNNKQHNHRHKQPKLVPTATMPTKTPVFVVPTTTAPQVAAAAVKPMATDAGCFLLSNKTTKKPCSSMADRDLLEMQGLIPLLPQLYPYKHPSSTSAAKIIG